MKKRIPIILAVILLVIAAIIVWQVWLKGPFRYAGTVEATEVDIPSRLGTVITSYEVKEGDKVAKSQLMVVLSGDEVKVDSDEAADDYHRAISLYQSGSMAKEAFNHIKSRWETSSLRVSWCNVKAPLAATVLTKYHEPGEWVNPGTKLLTLGDLSEVWAYVYVPETKLASLKLNGEIRGWLADTHQYFQGRISKINDEAEFTPKNVQTQAERTRLVYGVKCVFPNPDEILKPGMTIEVEFPK